jgi:hypothetical protein
VTFWGFNVKSSKNEDLEIWQSYIKTNKKSILAAVMGNLKIIPCPIDEHTMSGIVDEFEIVGQKDSFWLLKFIVQPEELNKMRARYRGYKYRQNNNYTKIGISTYSLNRLNQIKENNEFENLDDVLEYLVTERKDHRPLPYEAITFIPKNITNPIPLERRLTNLTSRLDDDDLDTIKKALEVTFLDAWEKAKTSRSRKKNKVDEEMDEQPLIKLLAAAQTETFNLEITQECIEPLTKNEEDK